MDYLEYTENADNNIWNMDYTVILQEFLLIHFYFPACHLNKI